MYQSRKNTIVFILTYALFVLAPTVVSVYRTRIDGMSIFYSAVYYHAVFGVMVGTLFIIRNLRIARLLRVLLSVAFSIFYFIEFFNIGFYLYTGVPLDLFFFSDSYEEVVTTGINVFGSYLIVMVVLFLILFVICCLSFFSLFRVIAHIHRSYVAIFTLLALIFVPTIVFNGLLPQHGHTMKLIKDSFAVIEARYLIEPEFHDNALQGAIVGSDNAFILQLESVSALALGEKVVVGGKTYEGTYLRYLRAMAKDGVFFPRYWSTTIQTNRAQVGILCGVVGNTRRALSLNLKLLTVDCLPKILKDAGYTTIFFRSDDLDFANEGAFASAIGFDEVHNEDIMRPDDPKYNWGYDDCVFYQRSFEYLKEQYPKPEKLFVYFEVSSHHYPWPQHESMRYLHPFKDPESYIEAYINSAVQQDYCAGKFYEMYKKYSPQNTHLLVTSDTSNPVGIHENNVLLSVGAYNENFLVPTAYVAPTKERSKYKADVVSGVTPGHDDIAPTVLELLSGSAHDNSFAFALRKDEGDASRYEDCHVLAQPYVGGYLAVVKGTDKYVFSIQDNRLSYYDLKSDWLERNPEVIDEHISYDAFRAKYYCNRYKS